MERGLLLAFLCLQVVEYSPPSASHTVSARDADQPLIIISEVNAANPSSNEDQDFIELYNTENHAVLLKNFVLVLYDGSVLQRAYDVIDLSNHAIQPYGYFVIGSANVEPRPDLVLERGREILQAGPDAVALYYGTPSDYVKGIAPTMDNLMDVVIYTRHGHIKNSPLIAALAPGQTEALESGMIDVSVSRCGGMTPRDLSLFRSTYPSPGSPNDCRSPPTPNIVINEVNADNPSYDSKEFIELYNPGDEDIPLDSFYLVLFDGENSRAYQVVNLSNRKITAKGYFVVGSSNVVPRPDYVIEKQNILGDREDGVALYYSPDSRIYELMEVTADNLLDAVVYSTGSWDGTNNILQTLTPGQQALHENSSANPGDVDESLSRCKGLELRSLSQFVVSYPTPGNRNNCSVNTPKIVLNEFSADNPSAGKEFVELYNTESKVVSLDSVFLLSYNGIGKAHLAIDLGGYTIPSNGYFTIAPDNPDNIPDHKLDKQDDLVLSGDGFFCLYYDPGGSYFEGMSFTFQYLLDGVPYAPKTWHGSDEILSKLVPENDPLSEDNPEKTSDIVLSLGRCVGHDPFEVSQWNRNLQKSTPGRPNICTDHSPYDPENENPQRSPEGSSDGGTVAAIVLGVFLALAILCAAGYVLYRRRRRKASSGRNNALAVPLSDMPLKENQP